MGVGADHGDTSWFSGSEEVKPKKRRERPSHLSNGKGCVERKVEGGKGNRSRAESARGQACSVWAGGLWEEVRRWGLAYAPSYSLGSPHKELTL